MNGKDAIRTGLASTQYLVNWFISDLSDADLLVRPVPGANHIAWQLGHLIHSECALGKELPGAAYPELPTGFADQHANKKHATDSDEGFASKPEYAALFAKVREATIANLDRVSDADLDRPSSGPVAKFAPTLGAVLTLMCNHSMMHAGQFTVVRRKLNKPVLF
jgi:uncharacterized damage-inducible protein DinB